MHACARVCVCMFECVRRVATQCVIYARVRMHVCVCGCVGVFLYLRAVLSGCGFVFAAWFSVIVAFTL